MDDVAEEHAPVAAEETPPAAPAAETPPNAPAATPSAEERTVHWSEVQTKKGAKVYMPAAARTLPPGEYICVVRIHIDGTGTPTRVDPLECPEVFRASAVEGAMAYQFYPLRQRGSAPLAGQFDLRVVYRVDGPADAAK